MRTQARIQMLCCLLWSSSFLQADEPKPTETAASLGTARDIERAADDRVIESLHKRVRADWSNVPLTEVFKSISSQHQIEIWIDHQELKAAKVSIDKMVDLHLGEVSIWQALHFLTQRNSLGWSISLGRVVITTGELATDGAQTRIYDVKRIVDALEPSLRKRTAKCRVVLAAL